MSNHRLTVVRVGPITLFFYALVMLPFWMIKYSIIALVLCVAAGADVKRTSGRDSTTASRFDTSDVAR
jgi:hypothetical protein